MKKLLSVKKTEKIPRLLSVEEEGDIPSLYRLTEAEYQKIGAPAPGSLLSEETEAAVICMDEAHRAQGAALRILSFGDNNRATLLRKLRQRGFSEAAADTALGKMLARGYIDEEAQLSRLCVNAANRKLWGPRRILASLAAKGYPPADIKQAIETAAAAGEIDFAANREALLQKKLNDDGDPQKKKALLYRYGF